MLFLFTSEGDLRIPPNHLHLSDGFTTSWYQTKLVHAGNSWDGSDQPPLVESTTSTFRRVLDKLINLCDFPILAAPSFLLRFVGTQPHSNHKSACNKKNQPLIYWFRGRTGILIVCSYCSFDSATSLQNRVSSQKLSETHIPLMLRDCGSQNGGTIINQNQSVGILPIQEKSTFNHVGILQLEVTPQDHGSTCYCWILDFCIKAATSIAMFCKMEPQNNQPLQNLQQIEL